MISLLLSLAAGACLYLILLNRWLIGMKDGPFKLLPIRGSMIAIGLGSAAFGWWAAGTVWLLAPALVLLAVLTGELRRLVIRRRCRGSLPVEMTNFGIALDQPDTTTDLAVLRYELPVSAWRGPDLRIVHVSDLHLNGDLPIEYYRAALAKVAELTPDVLVYTGDFVTRIEFATLLPDLLSAATGRLATLAVLGNHDYWADAERVAASVRSAGVTLLGNGCQTLDADGHSLVVCGYEGPWSSAPWQPPHVAPDELALMLTHTPDNIYRLSRLGFTAIFAGHYHAGQVRLPMLGSLVVPSRYGRRFDHGHFVVNGTHLFVTAGVGSAVPPKRIYCQPDVFVVDVRGTAHELSL
ncbi:MAG: metallophosphoesterase [Chloroflexi bacterium]|nr:metallophosphoesterase [Chloroflexota bacterium]